MLSGCSSVTHRNREGREKGSALPEFTTFLLFLFFTFRNWPGDFSVKGGLGGFGFSGFSFFQKHPREIDR